MAANSAQLDETSGRMEYLSRFNYLWQYRPGRLNVADPVSRRPHGQPVASLTQANARRAGEVAPAPVAVTVFQQRIQEGYQKDTWFAGDNTKVLHKKHDLWWRGNAIAVPDYGSLRYEILREFHSAPYSGHTGVNRMVQTLQKNCWWPHLRDDILNHVRNCARDFCQRNKSSPQKPLGELLPLQLPRSTWSSVSLDLITQPPKIRLGDSTIMVMVDRLSKMVHLAAMSSDGAAECLKVFLHAVRSKHGVPDELITDCDARFTSSVWTELMKALDIKMSLTSAYHTQSDGQTERMNRVLEDHLRHYVAPSQEDWDEHLPWTEFAMNNAFNKSIYNTPFRVVYGKDPDHPATVRRTHDCTLAAKHLRMQIQNGIERAKAAMLNAQQRYEAYADKKISALSLKVGDRVLVSTKNLRSRAQGAMKLMPRYIGPFPVEECIKEQAYRLRLPASMRLHNVFHVSLLEPYREDGHHQPPPATVFIDGDVQYDVEQ